MTIDPKRTALVVIDMQKGVAAIGRSLAPHGVDEVISNISKLIAGFRKAGGIIVLVHVSSIDGLDMLKPIVDSQPVRPARAPDYAEFMDETRPVEGDIVITKRQWGAFHGTELDLQLRRRGIDTIVLSGISTNIGVETTAREAYQNGYTQIFAEDAMTAASKEEHDSSIKFTFPMIGRVRKTNEILDAL